MNTRTALPTETADRSAWEAGVIASVEKGPIAVAAGDIDLFKAINDELGRKVGDGVLDLVLGAIKDVLPPEGSVIRWGGDLFMCAFPGFSPEGALLALDGVRRHLSGRRHLVGGGKRVKVSMTFGIAAYPHHVEDPSELVAAAHEALHRAKGTAKGTAAIYVEEKMVLKSNYYPRGQLSRLSSVAKTLARTEASLLREALAETLEKYRDLT